MEIVIPLYYIKFTIATETDDLDHRIVYSFINMIPQTFHVLPKI